MKIVIPVDQTAAAGIGTVAKQLIHDIPPLLRPEEALVLVGSLHADLVQHPRVRHIELSGPAPKTYGRATTKMYKIAREQWSIARAGRGADIVQMLDSRPPLLSRSPFVIIVHDVTYLDHPEWFPRSVSTYKRHMLTAALRRGPRAVVCVSNFTRERLLAHHGARLASIPVRVIRPNLPPPPQGATSVQEPEYMLTVSTIEPRKNHLTLLTATRRAREAGTAIRWKIVGRSGYESEPIVQQLKRERCVEVLGAVTDAELERLYRGATFVASPSYEEGFGFPPLEAMARGIPVVCSGGSAFDENVEQAGLRVEASDSEGWTQAIVAMTTDRALRERYRRAGLERATDFISSSAARAYVDLYREIAHG